MEEEEEEEEEEEGVYRGQKKRQRGGASEDEGGLPGRGAERWRAIFSFSPLSSLLLLLTLSSGSSLQQGCRWCESAAGSKVWIKRSSSVFKTRRWMRSGF